MTSSIKPNTNATDERKSAEASATSVSRTITLNNDVQQIPALHEFADSICEAVGIDDSITMQMNLALEEVVVNVMNYAYPKGTAGTIDIEARTRNKNLVFTITDSGIPFDPTKMKDADISLPTEERPIGGLGIFLVRQLMTSVSYERIQGKNVLTLCKSLNNQSTDI